MEEEKKVESDTFVTEDEEEIDYDTFKKLQS